MLTVGVVVEPLPSLDPYKDSTLLLMQSALERGYKVLTWQSEQMSVVGGKVLASAEVVTKVHLDQTPSITTMDTKTVNLEQCDLILFRKDPPFNMAYQYATYMLDLLEQQGVRVINKPSSVRDCNEKLFILQFSDAITDTVVSAQTDVIREFLDKHGDIIIKPLDGMGGAGIYRLRQNDPNITVILQHLTNNGTLCIMAQRYLPAIKNGDHRVLLLDGEPMPYTVARIAKLGETRANLVAGGHVEVRPLTDRQRELAQIIGPECKKRGLVIVGLDVIGDYVTEINITSPTCMRELLRETGVNYADALFAKYG